MKTKKILRFAAVGFAYLVMGIAFVSLFAVFTPEGDQYWDNLVGPFGTFIVWVASKAVACGVINICGNFIESQEAKLWT